MKIGILLALLIVTCLVASFGLQLGVLLQPSSGAEATRRFDLLAFSENLLKPDGGGEAPGPGIPR